MLTGILIAGFGGQGILFTGQLLAQAGMMDDLHVAWIPSYGPEMRGGAANCGVTLSTSVISSPLVTEPDVLIALNLPALAKFGPAVVPGGLILYNRSLTGEYGGRSDVAVIGLEASRAALECGDVRVGANVLLGVYLGLSEVVKTATVLEALKSLVPPHRQDLILANRLALEQGVAIGAQYRTGGLGIG